MDDEIKVGDTVQDVRYSGVYQETVIGVHDGMLWLLLADGQTMIRQATEWRKVKTPTLCPEGWANVSSPGFGPCWPTREVADAYATFDRIGVIHLSPNGDCEFIRTEEL